MIVLFTLILILPFSVELYLGRGLSIPLLG